MTTLMGCPTSATAPHTALMDTKVISWQPWAWSDGERPVGRAGVHGWGRVPEDAERHCR